MNKVEPRKKRFALTQVHATIIAACVGIVGPSAAIYVKYRLDQQSENTIIIKDTTASKPKPKEIQTLKSSVTQVYICNSKTSGKYHKSPDCYHLKACKNGFEPISEEDALNMGKGLCKDEH